ncbi:M3 family metallopeptidase [Actimicrobium sp. CCC2.4]|nr:M3 family metallopeptidase [Actimicrobium sp. CCC2.4]MEB0136878.1 M3 family metallopeptidase [Actimicrobium sp. CCC2.4]WPX34112.1 M3 family metallopeptidase [Actimicrobium sp. CCC2.4]
MSSQAAPALPTITPDNPFFAASTLPYQLPPFDRIKDADYAPAFADGMRQQMTEIRAIADNPAAPTFDNTIVAMERSGRLLHRVSEVFFNLSGTNTNAVMQALERDLAPKLSAHRDAIQLDGKLYARIDKLYGQRTTLALDAQSLRLLERIHTDFVRAGAPLPPASQQKLRDMNSQLASLATTFSQNVLNEINASAITVDTRAELDGLSDNAIAAAALAAKVRGLDGKYVLALVNTTGQPPASSLTNRALRQRLYDASTIRGSRGGAFDNRAIVLQLASLRADRAVLLGYPNHAAYVLQEETARTPAAVNQLLARLAPPALANARAEGGAIQKIIDADKGGFTLTAADWTFYTEKVRQARFDFDETQLRPYFELESVLQNGVFFAANKLYGLSFKERKDLPVYDPSVRVFEVFDADGKPLALFLADMYARSSKRGGAWMNSYVEQSELFGTRPVVANHLNIPQPPAGEPTLLTFDEVTTAFHEFGHALHGMLSNVRYPTFSGTSVPRDFVEFPSQVNEMWSVWPEVLANYARHYQTGAPMPQALLDKVLATRTFNEGFRTTEYLKAALIDQQWHQLAAGKMPTDVIAFEADALKNAGVDYAPVPPRYRSTYFSHVFAGGYSAGYYAYIWSEVLDADTVEWFKEHGGLTRKNGDWFRQSLLSRGGSVDAMQLFRDFRGRDAKIEPLLVRRGLTAP